MLRPKISLRGTPKALPQKQRQTDILLLKYIVYLSFTLAKWEYVWIGEFGERESYSWQNINTSGDIQFDIGYAPRGL